MKNIYLIITISPAGFKFVSFELTLKKPKPFDYTRGEGQCLVFKLIDWDCSTNFKEAMEDERVIDSFGEFPIEDIDLSSIPEKKLEHKKMIEDYKKQVEEKGFYISK